MEWLGDLERGFATAIYPNRVLIAGIAIIVAVVFMTLAWRGRWDRSLRHHPRAATVGLLLGLVLVVPAAWYLGSPLLLSTTIDEPAPVAEVEASVVPTMTPPATASLDVPTARSSQAPAATPTAQPFRPTERSGAFDGADDFHFARGAARLVETAPGRFTLRLKDFAVRNGPDLFVYLSPSEGYAKNAVELGRLKADRGNQNYRVAAGTDVASFRSVVIWCKQFGVLFGTAPLS